VAFDPQTGILHCVYGTSTKEAHYQQSSDSGATWSPPLNHIRHSGVTTTMGERGPKLSVPSGAGGQLVYVLWPDLWQPGVQTYARLVVSRNGGQNFSAPLQASDRPGIDGATLAADSSGGVLVAYHWLNASYPRPPNATEATWLFVRSSRDFGATWTPASLVATSATSVACSMCQMRARATEMGAFELAFRSAANDVREHYLLQASLDVTSTWQAQRVPLPGWHLQACPMNGPELQLSTGGAFSSIYAFMSSDTGLVFWSGRGAATGELSPPVGTPSGAGSSERYPTAVHSPQLRQVLMVWNVGPMAVAQHCCLCHASQPLFCASSSFNLSSSGIFLPTLSGLDSLTAQRIATALALKLTVSPTLLLTASLSGSVSTSATVALASPLGLPFSPPNPLFQTPAALQPRFSRARFKRSKVSV
jgi:hypothetical protein